MGNPAAIGAATGSTELVEYAFNHEGGKIPMCTALEYLKKEGIQEGSIRGMIEAYRDMGCSQEMIISKIKEKFHMEEDEIQLYL